MNTPADRPASLKRAPRAAKDESIDPVDPAPKPSTAEAAQVGPASPSAPVVRRKESKVSLSTLVAMDVDQLIAKVVAETGLSKRAVIEQAIRDRWGKSS
ncbi:MAG: hypothetical protein ACTHX2_15710 [Microbacterium sp.]